MRLTSSKSKLLLAALVTVTLLIGAGRADPPLPLELQESHLFPPDADVLREIPNCSNGELYHFFQVYHRIASNGMVAEALLAEARRRDGKLEKRMLDSVKSGMPDAATAKIDHFFAAKRYREAIAYMKELQRTRYPGGDFPYERRLADAWGALGNQAEEKEAWLRVLASKPASPADREAARKALDAFAKSEAIRQAYELLKEKRFAEAIAEADKGLLKNPGDRDYLALRREAVLCGEMDAVEQLMGEHRKKEALEAAQKLVSKYPHELQVRLLRARALVCVARFDEALPELEAIKSAHSSGHAFPGEFDLAEAYAASGDFLRGLESYELVAADPTIPDKDRLNAKRAGDLLGRKLQSRFLASVTYREEGTGKAWDFRSEYSHFLSVPRRAGVRFRGYETTLAPGLLLRSPGGSLWGSEAFLRERWGKAGFAEGWLGGGSFGKVSAGIAIGREAFHGSQPGDEFRAVWHQPSADSLELTVRGAVKDELMYTGHRLLTSSTSLLFSASALQVQAEDVRIGRGGELALEVKQTLVEKAEAYGLYLSYRGIHESFEGEMLGLTELAELGIDPALTRNPGNQFYEPAYDPHGLVLSGWVELGSSWLVYGSMGRLYDFADEIYSFQADAGFVWQVGAHAEVDASAGYYSDGTGAGSGGGSVVLGTVGMQLFF